MAAAPDMNFRLFILAAAVAGVTLFLGRKQMQSFAKIIGSAGLSLIKSFEGLSLTPYKDIAGFWTIGYGHLIKSGEDFSKGITAQQAEDLLKADIRPRAGFVSRVVKVPINQNQFDALVSLTYNIGEQAFAGSTVLRELNAGNIQKTAEAFLMWDKATIGGVKQSVRGLTRRREAERALFLA